MKKYPSTFRLFPSIHDFLSSSIYSLFQSSAALFLLVLLSPFWVVSYFVITLTSKGNFIFKQVRIGKNKKPFTLYKLRTMVEGAEKLQFNYLKKNEANGPVFKMRNDPRFTKVGKMLAHMGLDELPQLINIVKGDMAFVGPRPLPVNESEKIPAKYRARFSVLPGITSPWVINGSHKLPFAKWMELDIEYVKKKSVLLDLEIAGKTMGMLVKGIVYSLY